MSLKPWFQKAADQMDRESLERMTRQQAFDRGFLSVSDLDDEELRAGRCRDIEGKIPKTPGKTDTIPRDQYDEMILEHENRTHQRLRERMDTMIDVITGVAMDETVEPRDRFEAAKYIFERVAGKTPERVQVHVSKQPWEEMMGGIAKITREQSRGIRAGVIDAEVVYQDGEPDNPDSVPESGAETVGATDGPTEDTQFDDPTGFAPTVVPRSEFEYTYYPSIPVEDHKQPGNTSAVIPTSGPPDSPSWADLVARQEELAQKRKEARQRIKIAKKQRIIARTVGLDAWNGHKMTMQEGPEDSDGQVQITFGVTDS